MVVVAQLARASACGAEGCRIVPGRPPQQIRLKIPTSWGFLGILTKI